MSICLTGPHQECEDCGESLVKGVPSMLSPRGPVLSLQLRP